MVRLLSEPLAAVDTWIAQQDQLITRPEAIRRLIEIGLQAGTSRQGVRHLD